MPDPRDEPDFYNGGDISLTLDPCNWSGFDLIWERHPDRLLARGLAHIITKGALIGYFGPRDLIAHSDNYFVGESGESDVKFIGYALLKDLNKGWAIRVDEKNAGVYRPLIFSALSAVDKDHGQSRRVINDLSKECVIDVLGNDQSEGQPFRSVNENTYHFACPMPGAQDAMRLVRLFGRKAILGKLDFKSAYEHVSICEKDRGLLGMVCPATGRKLVSVVNIFGGRSSFAMFDLVARTSILWPVRKPALGHVIYIRFSDDIFIIGLDAATTPRHLGVDHSLLGLDGPDDAIMSCQDGVEHLLRVGRSVGFVFAPEKLIHSCSSLVFLGWELSSEKMSFKAAGEKIARGIELCLGIIDTDGVTNAKLWEICGLLDFFSIGIRCGRIFLGALFKGALHKREEAHTWRHLNGEMRNCLVCSDANVTEFF